LLLSESDIPLYDPLTFHQQLTAEGKSRVNACAHGAMSEWRWSHEMEVGAAPGTYIGVVSNAGHSDCSLAGPIVRPRWQLKVATFSSLQLADAFLPSTFSLYLPPRPPPD
jgi:hypothetical protein